MNMIVPTLKKTFRGAGILAFLTLLVATVQSGQAQPSEYERLAFQNEQPNIYVDVITLPGDTDGSVKLTPVFRLDYPFLSFKKADNTSAGAFASTAALNIEVFESPRKDLRPNKQVDVEGLNAVGRASWQDTAYAANYDQTQSSAQSLSGSMEVEVKPGHYTYILQLKINDETRGRNSRTRNVRVFPFDKQHNGDIVLVKNVDDLSSPSSLELINMGNNVPYGEDFYALVHLTDYTPGTTYTYTVNRVERRDPREDEDEEPELIKPMTEQAIPENQIFTGVKPDLNQSSGEVALSLSNSDNGFTYALVKIPNKSYPNAFYQLSVKAENQERPVARRLFQSYWSDIPTSLLSLDVAIDMLRFIADKETIKQIDKGSDREREQKFRDYWAQKDPTPDTEFNELQAEYYRRIDYTYEEFSSDRTPGYESDRGNIYIRYGAPQDIKRTFPTNGPTKEIWTYPSKTFVFEATTGFGDFKLISK